MLDLSQHGVQSGTWVPTNIQHPASSLYNLSLITYHLSLITLNARPRVMPVIRIAQVSISHVRVDLRG
jgi:hypothetical protein